MENVESIKEQLRALDTDRGVQYILNEAFRIIGNPVLVHDMEYKVVAFTEDVVTDDPIWIEYATTGTVSFERLVFFKDEDFLVTAADAKKITMLVSKKLKYDRLFGKLYNCEGTQIGCACMVESSRKFDEDDPMIFNLLCDVLDETIAKIEFFREYGQVQQEVIINSLIKNEALDKEILTAHVESIYGHLSVFLYLAVADISRCDSEQKELTYYRDLFKKTRPDFRYAICDDNILIIMSTDDPNANVKDICRKLQKIFNQYNIYVGISGRFENLYELRKYYNQAVGVLKEGIGKSKNKHILLFDETK